MKTSLATYDTVAKSLQTYVVLLFCFHNINLGHSKSYHFKSKVFGLKIDNINNKLTVQCLAIGNIMNFFLFLSGASSLSIRNGCVCLGDTLTYNCTVMGGGYTIWRGTAFSDCISDEQEILLIHLRFISNGGTNGTCNHGDIVGRSLGVEGSNYTSQLNVTVTSDVIGKNIMCSNEATNAITVCSTTITTTGIIVLREVALT